MVYQRRMMLKALETQAMCVAYVNPEGAQEAMQNYLNVAMPVDPAEIAAAAEAKDRQIQEVQDMKPFSLNDIAFGNPISGDDDNPPVTTSMHRPNR